VNYQPQLGKSLPPNSGFDLGGEAEKGFRSTKIAWVKSSGVAV
jgi:hypothetical protein